MCPTSIPCSWYPSELLSSWWTYGVLPRLSCGTRLRKRLWPCCPSSYLSVRSIHFIWSVMAGDFPQNISAIPIANQMESKSLSLANKALSLSNLTPTFLLFISITSFFPSQVLSTQDDSLIYLPSFKVCIEHLSCSVLGINDLKINKTKSEPSTSNGRRR